MRGLKTWLAGTLIVLAVSGCATTTSYRGTVEFGRLRVTTAVDVLPRPSEVPDVRYPEVLLAQSVEGTAELSFVVDVDGVPTRLQVIAASDPAFGEAAAVAVRRLRYVPARKDGRRAACEVQQTFFFRIQ